MKVYMLTGSVPPSMCGVGDYSERLVNALRNVGVDAEIVTSDDWSVAGGFRAARKLARCEPGVVHMQYPTNGYGHSLGPQVLAGFQRSVITLHEFTNVHPLRRLAEVPLAILGRHIVFTDEFERDAVCNVWPLTRTKSSVVTIGSNIDTSLATPSHINREILYFGAIYPRKGIEEFIELSRLAKKNDAPFKFRIAGLLKSDHRTYANGLREITKDLPVEWSLDQPSEKVIEYLSTAFLAYLPFPDGASDRRGSLKAVLQGALPCITTQGLHSMPDLSSAVMYASDPADAYGKALELLQSPEKWNLLSAQAKNYAQRYSWEDIARKHKQLYQSLSAV